MNTWPGVSAGTSTSITVAFEVEVPADTPGQVFIASSATGWTHEPLTRVSASLARGSLTVPRGEWFDYKVTRGSFDTVEKLADCSERANRYRFGAPSSKTITVATWRDRCN